MTERPTKGTAEHRAWVIACVVEAARRAGRPRAEIDRALDEEDA